MLDDMSVGDKMIVLILVLFTFAVVTMYATHAYKVTHTCNCEESNDANDLRAEQRTDVHSVPQPDGGMRDVAER